MIRTNTGRFLSILESYNPILVVVVKIANILNRIVESVANVKLVFLLFFYIFPNLVNLPLLSCEAIAPQPECMDYVMNIVIVVFAIRSCVSYVVSLTNSYYVQVLLNNVNTLMYAGFHKMYSLKKSERGSITEEEFNTQFGMSLGMFCGYFMKPEFLQGLGNSSKFYTALQVLGGYLLVYLSLPMSFGVPTITQQLSESFFVVLVSLAYYYLVINSESSLRKYLAAIEQEGYLTTITSWTTAIRYMFNNGILFSYDQFYRVGDIINECFRRQGTNHLVKTFHTILLNALSMIMGSGIVILPIIYALAPGIFSPVHVSAFLIGPLTLDFLKIYYQPSSLDCFDETSATSIMTIIDRFNFANGSAIIDYGTRTLVQPKVTKSRTVNLVVKDLNYSIGNRKILSNINFSLKPKEKKLILGPNGSGKTSFFNVLSGQYDLPNRDEVLSGVSERDILYLDERPSFIQGTLIQNILLDLKTTPELLTEVDSLKTELKLTLPNESPINPSAVTLSAGEQKKVQLLRAYFYTRYYRFIPILLLDQILSNLDPASRKVCNEFLNKKFENHSFLITTHEPEKYSVDKITLIDKGSICGEGTEDQLQNHETYRAYMGI